MTGVDGSPMLVFRNGPVRFALGVLLTLTALALAWAVWVVNLERSCTLEQWPELRVELDQGSGDAEAQGARLAGGPAPIKGGVDVVRLGELGSPKGLGEDHLVGLRREVVSERPLVHGDGAVALALVGSETHTGDGLLAATGGLDEGLGHAVVSYAVRRAAGISRASGICAEWGWFGPAYTFSFVSI